MKIDLAALIQLAASGNSKTVEERWMEALERHADDPPEVARWASLLKELADRGRTGEAEPLAWAAIEAVKENAGAPEALKVAGPFLLALNRSNDLKAQVAELYTAAYADRENFDALLEESGVAGGRPPRRALRTLDLCLNIEVGDHLVARHEDEAARVEAIDRDTWEVTVATSNGTRTFGPVELADEYAPAEENDFRVLRQFAPDRLREMLAQDPAQIVIGILRGHGDHMNSDALADRLTPDPIPQSEWTKWWGRARAALKRNGNVRISGRSPYELSYHAVAITLESDTEARFKNLYDPLEQLACIECYLRECKGLGRGPDVEMLGRFKARIDQIVRRQMKARFQGVLTPLLVARALAVARGAREEEADRPLVDFLAAAAEPTDYVKAVTSEALWPAACRCLKAAHPEKYVEFCAALLVEAPTGACDMLADGLDRARLERAVQRILKDPIRHVGALAWLWQGPQATLNIPLPPPATLCSKLVGVAGEIRRRDDLPREITHRIQNRLRDALSARQYARFKQCLEQTDAGVAATWRTQIARFDHLGRSVPEDLVKLIRAAFPEQHRTPPISPWKREDVLYETAGGRGKLMAAINELVNVRMRANAKAIGEAAAHGDLSENSEYKSALEERDLLRARLAKLRQQSAQVVVLDPSEVEKDRVGFGARVTLRSAENGHTVQVTFLGPWDADVDRRIYNYKSPVGQDLMGLTPGDTVNVSYIDPPGEYVIERIENALRAQGDPPQEVME